MDVLRKINKMRLDRGWSIYRLSVEADIPQSTLTNMFNRETLPSITTLTSICTAFGTTLSDFFSEEALSGSVTDYNDELLELFNSISSDSQAAIITLLREMNNNK